MIIRMFLVMSLIASLLTGCWSRAELDEVFFIDGIYFDPAEDGNVQVSIGTFLSSKLQSGEQSEKPYTLVSKSAPSIADALASIQKDLTRRINFSHTQIVLVSDEYAKQGLDDLFEWVKREPTLELDTYILSVSGKAKDIAQLVPITEQLPSEVFKRFAEQNYILNTTISDCLVSAESNMGFPMSSLSYGNSKIASQNGESQLWASMSGLAVFQDRKIKGILPMNEAVAVSWALKKLERPVYSVKWDDGKSKASVLFVRVSSKISYSKSKGTPFFTIMLKGKANLVFKKAYVDRTELEENKIIVKKLEEQINQDMKEALQHTQLWRDDVLNLGMLIEWNDPKVWRSMKERWPDIYKDGIGYAVKSNVQLSNLGSKR